MCAATAERAGGTRPLGVDRRDGSTGRRAAPTVCDTTFFHSARNARPAGVRPVHLLFAPRACRPGSGHAPLVVPLLVLLAVAAARRGAVAVRRGTREGGPPLGAVHTGRCEWTVMHQCFGNQYAVGETKIHTTQCARVGVDHKHILSIAVRGDDVPDVRQALVDDDARLGPQGVLHLHRFDDDESITGLDRGPSATRTSRTLPGIGPRSRPIPRHRRRRRFHVDSASPREGSRHPIRTRTPRVREPARRRSFDAAHPSTSRSTTNRGGRSSRDSEGAVDPGKRSFHVDVVLLRTNGVSVTTRSPSAVMRQRGQRRPDARRSGVLRATSLPASASTPRPSGREVRRLLPDPTAWLSHTTFVGPPG